ncbi:MAG: transglutaminase family protein [Kiritimatiellaeota bacterium]|nr:transglutaminase family protein [Kiritimatiellota bacterium]
MKETVASVPANGHAVDADLVQHDVRLTMGGEPTFVSIDDPDGAECFPRLGKGLRLVAGTGYFRGPRQERT